MAWEEDLPPRPEVVVLGATAPPPSSPLLPLGMDCSPANGSSGGGGTCGQTGGSGTTVDGRNQPGACCGCCSSGGCWSGGGCGGGCCCLCVGEGVWKAEVPKDSQLVVRLGGGMGSGSESDDGSSPWERPPVRDLHQAREGGTEGRPSERERGREGAVLVSPHPYMSGDGSSRISSLIRALSHSPRERTGLFMVDGFQLSAPSSATGVDTGMCGMRRISFTSSTLIPHGTHPPTDR